MEWLHPWDRGQGQEKDPATATLGGLAPQLQSLLLGSTAQGSYLGQMSPLEEVPSAES